MKRHPERRRRSGLRPRMLGIEALERRQLLTTSGIDLGFGDGGRQLTNFGWLAASEQAYDAVLSQPDGKIVVVGQSRDTVILARYDANGNPDVSFGTGGKTALDLGSGSRVAGVVRQASGKIVVAGTAYGPGGNDLAVARFTADGMLDPEFGDRGLTITDTGEYSDSVRALTLDRAGRIIIGGTNGDDQIVARYTPDGVLDVTFDGDGVARTDLGGYGEPAVALAIDQDDRIVAVASVYRQGSFTDFAVVRYNSDGSLDTAFDGDGKVFTDFGMGMDDPVAAAYDADGRLLVVGSSHRFDMGGGLVMARYLADGSLDPAFDGDGKATANLATGFMPGQDLVFVDGGRILVAGTAVGGTNGSDFGVIRVNADGSVDPSFGVQGMAVADFASGEDTCEGMLLDALGRAVLVGTAAVRGTRADFGLARFDSAGLLDATFGTAGRVTTNFGDEGTEDFAADMVAAGDGGGTIVVGQTDRSLVVAKYDADGRLDPAFGDEGKRIVSINMPWEQVAAATVQPDGRIVVVGDTYGNATGFDYTLVRLRSDGSLDPDFAGQGWLASDFGSKFEHVWDVTLDGENRILVAGSTERSGRGYFAVARYLPNGVLDATFDNHGLAMANLASYGDEGRRVAVDKTGRIIVAGQSYRNGREQEFGLVRFNDDGSLDTTFDGDGMVVTDFASSSDYVWGLAIDGQDRIVVAGTSWTNAAGSDVAVARYNVDGSLDTTFDGDGLTTLDSGSKYDDVRDVLITTGDKIIVVGATSPSSAGMDFAVLQLQQDGSPDTTFDGDGFTTTDLGSLGDEGVAAFLDGERRIVVAGISGQPFRGDDFAVVRYLPDGRVDGSFGADGQVTTNIAIGGTRDEAVAVAVQMDGKTVVLGNAEGRFAVARYDAEGNLDPGFGAGGRVLDGFEAGWTAVSSLAIQADGKILVGGTYRRNATDHDFAVARFESNGTRDAAFGNGGLAFADFGQQSEAARSLVVDASGRIVVAGDAYVAETGYDVALARFLPDGSLDSAFGADGRVLADLGMSMAGNQSVAIDGEGRILMAGSAYRDSSGRDFALARFNPDGSVDTTFDTDGVVFTDFGTYEERAFGIALDARGILVAGTVYRSDTGRDVAVARYQLDGSLDTTFGTDGWVATHLGSFYDGTVGIAVVAGDVVVVASTEGADTSGDFAVIKYNSDGLPVTTFGTNGVLTSDFGGTYDAPVAAAVDRLGRLVVAGSSERSITGYDFAVARYEFGALAYVVGMTPNGPTAAPVNAVRLTFASPMQQESFSLADDVGDFLGPQGPLPAPTGFTWVDPRTLEIQFAPQTAIGRYELTVGPRIRDADGGEMDQDLDGSKGELPDDQYRASFAIAGPRIVEHSPSGITKGAVSSVRLSFDRAMDTSSFALDQDVVRFSGPAGALPAPTSFQWIDNRTLDVLFAPQELLGNYELLIGSGILDAAANPLDQDQDLVVGEVEDDRYQAKFTLDAAPRAVAHAPAGLVPGPISQLRIEYNKPMSPTSFKLADDLVSFTGPAGVIAVSAAEWVDAKTLRLSFAPQSAVGDYELVLGPDVQDAAGGKVDQDQNGVAGEVPADDYRAKFTVDTLPRVVGHIPPGAVTVPVQSLQVSFSKAMKPGSFSVADDVASFTGPEGAIGVSSASWIDADTLELAFPRQSALGTYTLVLGPQIFDERDHPLDQDGDGTAGEADQDRYSAVFTIDRPPRIVGHEPAGKRITPVSAIRLDFSETMDPASFLATDDVVSFRGPGGNLPLGASRWLDGKTLELEFDPQSAPGDYELVVGPGILDPLGLALDQDGDGTGGEVNEDRYVATFTLDVPPRIVGHTPTGSVKPPLNALEVEFSKAMDPSSFSVADDVVSFAGPGGPIAVSGHRWRDTRTLELSFTPQVRDGQYTLVLGPQILDAGAFALDQDRDLSVGEVPDDTYSASFEISGGVYITGHEPSGDQTRPVSEVNVTFSEEITLASFTAADVSIQGPSGPIELSGPPVRVSGNTYRLAFATQTAYGTYHVFVGPAIADLDGFQMDQDHDGVQAEPTEDRYDASFTLIDVTGPRVSAHAPLRPVRGPIASVDVEFSEPIKSDSVQNSDVTVTGPAGDVAVSDVERLDARRYRVHFASQSREGAYQVTVGPEIQDLAGNRMDQDGDGEKGEAADDRYTFVVRIDTTPPHVVSSAPLGTLNVPVHEVELTFNEAVDAATLPTSAVTVFSPGGSRHATEIAARDETRVVLRFAPENTDGAFRVEVAPLITDLAGNALDQDADGVGGEPQDDLYTTAFTQLLPDLTVTSLTSPAEFPAGRVADIEWTVANVGGGAATGVWTDTVYLSADNAAGNDVELARVQFDQPVAAGERYQRTVPVTIPADARGSRWLVVVTNRVGELAEAGAGSGNNTKVAVSPIWVTARPYADLRVSDVQAPASLSAGEEAAISWTVRNHGTGATSAPAWQDVVYLSADDRLDGRDVELKRFANPDFLAPGESYTRTEEVYIPQSSLGSAVYVIVATDVQDREEEFDFENNNTERTAAAVPVVASLPARLTVTKVEPPAAVAVGSSPTFRWTVTNTGGTTISSGWYNRTGWDDGLVLSRDDVYQEQEDFFLGSHNYFTGLPLRPGQSYTQTGRGERAIPYWEPGTYYLIVIPDTHWGAGAAFRESTIPRDYGVAPIQLTDTNPVDLVVASVGAPTVSEVGASLKIDWQVTNRGGARSEVSTWDDEVFLSRDRQLDATDVSLGANHQSRLLPQSASYEMTAQPFVVPADFVPGDYYVVVETDSGDHLREADNNNNTLASTHPVRILRIETDLQVTSVQAPVNVTAGDSVNVSWVVRNAAQDATRVATWEDAVYLSSDDNLNVQEDRKLGAFPHSGALSFQDEYPRSEQVLFPDNVEGTFSLFVVTDSRDDVHELNAEGNNAKAPDHRVQLSDLAPNLVVQELTVPASAIAGTQVEIGWSVKNSGDAPAQPAWTDTVYLSADATLDRTKDKMLTFLRHDATLAVQDSYGPAGGITRVIVPDRLDGEFFIFFVSDSGDAVYEKAATADNVVSRPIRITDLAPDLEVRSASVPQTGVAGQAIEVGFSIANKGTEHTGVSWRDAFYLSADTQFDPQQDRLFGAFVRTTPVGIGADYGPPATPAYLRLPDRIEGPYYVFVVADYENAVYEKSEGADNVFRVEHPITVELQAPDLRAAVTDAPAAATAGTVINVSWTVTNRGLQPTSETVWQDGVYLSADAIFEPAGDIELGVVTHSGILARDAGYTQVRPFELRQDLEGTHHIYVVADVRRQVFEHTAEDNNLGANAWATQITGVHADLQVTALDAPSAASTGSAISVSWTVANRGDDATPGGTWVDAVYLSRDEALDAGDRQLATLPHQDRLSAGGTYARQVQVTLPSDLSGSLFLLVKTDASPFNQLYEYQAEDNNVRSRAVEVSLVPPADLRVTAVTIPASGWSGQKMLVQWTVANEGGLAAQTEQRGWYDSVYLSRDPYLDPGTDVHLGAVLHEGTLAPSGASYAAQAETRLPVGAAGPYYVLVRTDSNNRLPEGNAEQNNTTASLATISIQLTPPADLEVTSATAPAAGNCGEPADWEYRVVNQGTLDAMGAWYDSLYLSADATWDLDDPRIARVYHEGDLAQNAGYTQTVTAGVPPVLPGDYYLIVRTDVRDNVRESGQGEENNTLVSSAQIRVEARQLELGQADSSRTLTTDGQRYYRIEDVPSGKTLRLSLTGLGDAASARLYVSRDRLPTRIAFDVASGEPSSHPQLLIPDTLGGTYYVLVYGEQIPNGPASYSILAEALSLSVFDTQYGQGGNAGRLTIEITGAAFDRTVTARLSDGAAWQLPAVDHYYVDKTRLFATFDLLGVTPGTYDVVVSNGEGATRIVRNGLRVAAGGGGSVRPQIDAPTLVRRKRGFPFTVQWTNEGLNDAPAPLLTVGNSAAFGFSPNDTSAGMRYTFLGVSTDGGPPGILRPGQTESLTLHATGEESQEAFHLFVDRVLKDPSAPFDWSEVRDDMQPIDLTSGEFQPVFEHIVNKVGRTAGDYLAMLSRNAGLLPLPPGERPEVRSLLALEVADAWAELGTSIRGALSTEDLSIQLGGRSVAATETISGAVYTALTRNDGSFVFPNLPPGAYQFAVPQLLVTQVSPAIADLAAGQALTGVSIGVERGAVLTVSVRAAADHAVIAGAIVSVRSGDQIVGAGVADAQGSATMSPLPFGSYTLVVEGAGGAPKTVSDVSVSQTTQELLLELEPQAVIRGHATRLGDAAADLPIVVAATLPGTDFVQFAIVNEDGVFAVEGLAAGTYDLVFAAQGHQGQVLSGLAVSAGMAADVGDVRLVPNPSPEMEGETPQKGPDPAKMADQKFHEALEEAEKYFRWVLFPGVYLARGAEYVGILKQFLDSTAPNLTHRTYLPGSETVEGLELASLSTVAVYTGKMPGFRDSSTSEDLFSKVMAHARTAVVDMFKKGNPAVACDKFQDGKTVEFDIANLDFGKFGYLRYTDGNRPDDEKDEWAFDDTIAGGVGHGGNPPPPREVPDRRSLTGKVVVRLLDPTHVEVKAKDFRITVDDTFDFWPGNLAEADKTIFWVTSKLYVLEIYNHAYDVAFTVMWNDKKERSLTGAIPKQQCCEAESGAAGETIGESCCVGDSCDDGPHDDDTDVSESESHDPNDKIGPSGIDMLMYVDGRVPLPYMVRFENDAKASASAILVTITDQLDGDLDWGTFELRDMQFGSHRISVPPGLTQYQTRVDLRPEGSDLLVEVDARFDVRTGLAQWTFTGIDPATGELTWDPLAGFLPPNNPDVHDGEGFVTYALRPKAGLPSGTEISNMASIVFDWNEPIDTPLIVHRIDAAPPASAVDDLPVVVNGSTFQVTWAGADDALGSGVKAYDIYVSDNGGPYQRWLAATQVFAASFIGRQSHTYRFFSTATDYVGHWEYPPVESDAQTTVASTTWNNPKQPTDVNGDGHVLPIDVLLIINYINVHPNSTDPPAPPAEPPPFYDVSNDRKITPLDVLMVINYINVHGQREAEGEATVASDSGLSLFAIDSLFAASVANQPLTSSPQPSAKSSGGCGSQPASAAEVHRSRRHVRPARLRVSDQPQTVAAPADLEEILPALAEDIAGQPARIT